MQKFLQCAAVCSSVLQCAVHHGVMQCVALYCSACTHRNKISAGSICRRAPPNSQRLPKFNNVSSKVIYKLRANIHFFFFTCPTHTLPPGYEGNRPSAGGRRHDSSRPPHTPHASEMIFQSQLYCSIMHSMEVLQFYKVRGSSELNFARE